MPSLTGTKKAILATAFGLFLLAVIASSWHWCMLSMDYQPSISFLRYSNVDGDDFALFRFVNNSDAKIRCDGQLDALRLANRMLGGSDSTSVFEFSLYARGSNVVSLAVPRGTNTTNFCVII